MFLKNARTRIYSSNPSEIERQQKRAFYLLSGCPVMLIGYARVSNRGSELVSTERYA